MVANHILEHVESPDKVVGGIKKLLANRGTVYIGFPEATNFTDIFYHLIHQEGGGHIQKLTKEKVVELFLNHGFKLQSCQAWPDDWTWLEKLYDYKGRGIEYISQK